MSKFIEIHHIGRTAQPVLINLDHVEFIQPNGDGTTHISQRMTSVTASESYEQVRLLIGAAQGGIPMARETEKN